MGWTSTYWKSVDDIEDGYPISVNINYVIDTINPNGIKYCWVVLGDYLVKAGATYIEGINTDGIKFVWYTDFNTFGLPRCAVNLLETYVPTAFRGYENLTKIKIPESVKYIDYYAFYDTGLTEVTIAQDCVYQDSSFPAGCTINYYS